MLTGSLLTPRIKGLSKVFYSSSAPYGPHLAEPIAPLLKALLEKGSYTHLLAGHTAVGRDTIPRVAALIDSSQISDIVEVQGEDTFVRPIYAGNALATVKSSDKVKVVTVRGTAFDKAPLEGGSAEKEKIDATSAEGKSIHSDLRLSLPTSGAHTSPPTNS